MRDDDAPISLFSFQDIVTSLTGIMMIIILTLSIEILRLQELNRRESKLRKEVEAARLREERAKERRKELEDVLAQYKSGKSLRDVDVTRLRLKRKQLEEQCAAYPPLLERLRQQEEENRILAEEEKKRAERLAQLQKEQAQKQEDLERNERKIERLKEEDRQIAQETEKRRRKLKVQFTGDPSRIPLLLELSDHGVRMRKYQKGSEIQDIPMPSPLVADLATLLRKQLSEYSSEGKYSLVFFVKPSAARYLAALKTELAVTLQSFQTGYEPILENEDTLTYLFEEEGA